MKDKYPSSPTSPPNRLPDAHEPTERRWNRQTSPCAQTLAARASSPSDSSAIAGRRRRHRHPRRPRCRRPRYDVDPGPQHLSCHHVQQQPGQRDHRLEIWVQLSSIISNRTRSVHTETTCHACCCRPDDQLHASDTSLSFPCHLGGTHPRLLRNPKTKSRPVIKQPQPQQRQRELLTNHFVDANSKQGAEAATERQELLQRRLPSSITASGQGTDLRLPRRHNDADV